MASLARALLLATLASGAVAERAGSSSGAAANPIRRVVTMLQKMQGKVAEEGKRDEELFDKFMCYCKTGSGDLESSIAQAKAKIPQVDSSLKEATAMKQQLDKDIAQHKEDREDAKATRSEATALREKEAAAFTKESSDAQTNIAALGKAIGALEKGSGSFLQTSTAAVLRRLTVDVDMSSGDRELLSSFLAQGQGYVPQSGQIIGILKQMKDTMEKDLSDSTSAEETSKADFKSLVAAKEKEIAANTQAIEEKLGRSGEVGIEVETLKEDLSDTETSLAEDEKFLADLGTSCKSKQAEWEEVKKTRADELLALAETIKILNDDDALELWKKTLPSPSLLQTEVSDKEARGQAIKALQAGRRAGVAQGNAHLDLLVLALQGRQNSFEKVITMIDEMVVLLKREQADDDDKKEYCEASLDKTEDEKKVLDLAISDLEKAVADAKAQAEKLEEEIVALDKGVEELDHRVAEATANRKAENKEYSQTLTEDTDAKEVLGLAVQRLNMFYNPKMAPTLVQVAAHSQSAASSGRSLRGAPPPPPETFGAYVKKGEESAGVLTLIKMLIADLDKEIQQIEVEEKDAQQEYEQLMADAAAKRAADSMSIEEKEAALADVKAQIQKMAQETKSKMTEAMATAKAISDLHLECDWLLANFEARKEARSGEAESLKNAKAVLSGADYSL